jgi:RNA polymerase sigma factor (sigma-70 family)
MRQNFSTYTDEKLVFLLRSDKREESEIAFTEVYNRYSSKVHAYCLRVLNNNEQAEDIFQEVFIRFFQKIKSNYPETNVPGYLIKIARNLCLNYKRDKVNTISIQENDVFFEPGKSFENSELLDLITTALELLDFEYKEAFEYIYFWTISKTMSFKRNYYEVRRKGCGVARWAFVYERNNEKRRRIIWVRALRTFLL